jgi:hypothetical protein
MKKAQKGNIQSETLELSLKTTPETKILEDILRKSDPLFIVEAPNWVKEQFKYYIPGKSSNVYDPKKHIYVWNSELSEVYNPKEYALEWPNELTEFEGEQLFYDDEINLEIISPEFNIGASIPIVRNRKTGVFHRIWESQEKKENIFRLSGSIDPNLINENTNLESKISNNGKKIVIKKCKETGYRLLIPSSMHRKLGEQHLPFISIEDQKKLEIYFPQDEIFKLAMERLNKAKKEYVEKLKNEGKWEELLEKNPLNASLLTDSGSIFFPQLGAYTNQVKKELGIKAECELRELTPILKSIDNSKNYIEMLCEMQFEDNSLFTGIKQIQNLVKNVFKGYPGERGWENIVQESLHYGKSKPVKWKDQNKAYVESNLTYSQAICKDKEFVDDKIKFKLLASWENVLAKKK